MARCALLRQVEHAEQPVAAAIDECYGLFHDINGPEHSATSPWCD
jgi:hypothetical protein